MLIHWTLRSQHTLGCSKLTVSQITMFIRGGMKVIFKEVTMLDIYVCDIFRSGKLPYERFVFLLKTIKMRI